MSKIDLHVFSTLTKKYIYINYIKLLNTFWPFNFSEIFFNNYYIEIFSKLFQLKDIKMSYLKLQIELFILFRHLMFL